MPTGGMAVPDVYRKMYTAGLVDPNSDRRLQLSDLTWSDISEIPNLRASAHAKSIGLLEFAHSARGDAWAWYDVWIDQDAPETVVTCQVDLRIVEGYAPSSIACIYRLLIEEFSSSWLISTLGIDEAELQRRFQSYADAASNFLPSPWGENLRIIATRPVSRGGDGTYGVLPSDEAERIIHTDLQFHRLNIQSRV